MLRMLVAGYALGLLATSLLALIKRVRWLLQCALIVALGWLLTLLLTMPRDGWLHPQWGIFIADAVVLVSFALVTLRSRSIWLNIATGIQFATVSLHVAYAMDPALSAEGYAGATQLLGWGVLGTLAFAAIRLPRATAPELTDSPVPSPN
jgi:hypothetical protein